MYRKKHTIYGVLYYPRFQVSTGDLGTCPPWISGDYFTCKYDWPLYIVKSLAQWLRVCLPMQETRVRALVREDPTCRGETKPVRHDC